MAGDEDRRVVAGHFREMAAEVVRDLPLYRRVCEACTDDAAVLDLVATARPQQARPVLLLAAVHDAVLAGGDHPLADWYPSVREAPRPVGAPGSADDPWPAFRDLALSSARVAEDVATRSTQTNEVNRCGALLPAFATIADAVGRRAGDGRPLALVELGTSAGLNLLLDRYSYDYGGDGRLDPTDGPSPVVVRTERHGPTPIPVPAVFPAVGSRLGLDVRPIDVTDPSAARWLVACLWPEQAERLDRVRAAIGLAQGSPPPVVRADIAADLVPALADVPGDHELVCFATWVLTYLDLDEQRALTASLDEIGAGRDLHLVYGERLEEVPGLPQAARPDRPDDDRFTALVWLQWRDGRRTARRLGDMHPHALSLDWSA